MALDRLTTVEPDPPARIVTPKPPEVVTGAQPSDEPITWTPWTVLSVSVWMLLRLTTVDPEPPARIVTPRPPEVVAGAIPPEVPTRLYAVDGLLIVTAVVGFPTVTVPLMIRVPEVRTCKGPEVSTCTRPEDALVTVPLIINVPDVRTCKGPEVRVCTRPDDAEMIVGVLE